jgi:hypothetical protein
MSTIQKGANIQLGDLGSYADIYFDPSDSKPDYIGLNMLLNASTAGSDWKVYKFTYSGDSSTRIQFNYGAWNNRASLF